MAFYGFFLREYNGSICRSITLHINPAIDGFNDGKMEKMLMALARDLYEQSGVDITECFIDGMFVPAKKGLWDCKTKRGKGTKIMGIANGDSLPAAICTNSTDTHEIKCLEKTMEHRFSKKKPKRLIRTERMAATSKTKN